MKVLVVEDEKKIASFIRKGLEAQGFAVDEANHGNAGYELATNHPYDAIVLDIMLPGRDGLSMTLGSRPPSMRERVDAVAVESDTAGMVTWPHHPISIYNVPARVPLEDAVVRSAATRAQPIVLTGLAAMLGAFFILDDPIFNGLAISLVFGIFVSTVLTLIVIPLLYYAAYRRVPSPVSSSHATEGTSK